MPAFRHPETTGCYRSVSPDRSQGQRGGRRRRRQLLGLGLVARLACQWGTTATVGVTLAGLALAGLTLAGLTLTVLAPLGAPRCAYGAEGEDLARDLALAARESADLRERLEAAGRVLASELPLDPDRALRAALSLWTPAPDPALWLALRGLDAGRAERPLHVSVRERAAAGGQPRGIALAYLMGERPESAVGILAAARRDPLVLAVLEREVGTLIGADAGALDAGGQDPGEEAVGVRLAATRLTALALDQALEDDTDLAFQGLDALRAMGPEANELLRHEAELGVVGQPQGRMERAARACLLLGVRKDVEALPVLARALQSPNGWVRAAAATALADLGEPEAAVPLAWHLCVLGDRFRQRDQWEYPGVSETDIALADWGNVEYFAVDSAAADALLALGIPGALGYLLHEKLDPLKGWFRIRVLQDSSDALDRHAPWLREAAGDMPYCVDQGSSLRRKSFERMALAWHARRGDPAVLRVRLDERNVGFAKRALALASLLAGESVRDRMIARSACSLLGSPMTPSLLSVLGESRTTAGLLDVIRTLGDVRDERVVAPLLALLADERPTVRAAAAESLAAFAFSNPEVVDALLRLLGDRSEEARSGALRGLIGAPRSPRVLAALDASANQQPLSGDDAILAQVARFVQSGDAAWAEIEVGLSSTRVYVRRTWWDLLRRALDLPPWVHDPVADPQTADHRRLSKEAALSAWKERAER